MSCKIDLPTGGDAASLKTRFTTMLPGIGEFAETLLTDAVDEFLRESCAWRFVQYKAEVSTGDREIHLDMGTSGVELVSVKTPIYQIVPRGPECQEIPVTRQSDGEHTGFSRQRGRGHNEGYSYGQNNGRYGGSYAHYDYSAAQGKTFYEPYPGVIIFSETACNDETYRIEMILTVGTFAGVNLVPRTLLRAWREGLVSSAIVKAMEMPGNRAWTAPKENYNPAQYIAVHAAKSAKALRKAKRWHAAMDADANMPYRDRYSIVDTTQYRLRHPDEQ